jgi:hypothetical protein
MTNLPEIDSLFHKIILESRVTLLFLRDNAIKNVIKLRQTSVAVHSFISRDDLFNPIKMKLHLAL